MNRFAVCGAFALVFVGYQASAATIELFDFGLNIDGVTSCGFGPCDTDGLFDLSGIPGVDDSSFDSVTGLGTLSVMVSGPGSHNVDLFLDHQIDDADNGFFNEFGDTNGAPVAGQSWEIDEPGFVFGNLFDNFLVSTLDNSNGVPAGFEDDPAMAMGWDFTLGAGESADISFLVSTTAPTSGFFLSHTDPDAPSNGATIFFSSELSINTVPEPGVLLLFGIGLGATFYIRRNRFAR